MLAGDTSLHHYQQNIRAGAKQTILFSEVKANITSETFLVASDIQGLRSGSIREIRLEKGDLSLVKAACAKARNCMQLCAGSNAAQYFRQPPVPHLLKLPVDLLCSLSSICIKVIENQFRRIINETSRIGT